MIASVCNHDLKKNYNLRIVNRKKFVHLLNSAVKPCIYVLKMS